MIRELQCASLCGLVLFICGSLSNTFIVRTDDVRPGDEVIGLPRRQRVHIHQILSRSSHVHPARSHNPAAKTFADEQVMTEAVLHDR